MTKYAVTLAKSISQSFFLALETETRQEEETMLGHFEHTDKQTNSQIMSKDKKKQNLLAQFELSSQAASSFSNLSPLFQTTRTGESWSTTDMCGQLLQRRFLVHALLKIDDVDNGFYLHNNCLIKTKMGSCFYSHLHKI